MLTNIIYYLSKAKFHGDFRNSFHLAWLFKLHLQDAASVLSTKAA